LAVAMIAVPLAFAELSRRAVSPIGARRRAASGAAVVTAIALGYTLLQAYDLVPTSTAFGLGEPRERWHVLLPLFVSLIGLTSIAMTPARCARPLTFARTLVMLAASLGLVLSRDAMALSL